MDKQKRKSGRPKSGVNKRSIRIVVSSTSEQKEIISKKAASVGMTVSKYLLESGLEKRINAPMPAINRKIFLELNAIRHNLNTLNIMLQKNKKVELQSILITLEILEKEIAQAVAILIGKSAYVDADLAAAEVIRQDTLDPENAALKNE